MHDQVPCISDSHIYRIRISKSGPDVTYVAPSASVVGGCYTPCMSTETFNAGVRRSWLDNRSAMDRSPIMKRLLAYELITVVRSDCTYFAPLCVPQPRGYQTGFGRGTLYLHTTSSGSSHPIIFTAKHPASGSIRHCYLSVSSVFLSSVVHQVFSLGFPIGLSRTRASVGD